MCQITVSNLHNETLNKRLFLIMGSLGSIIHKDGWGFSDLNGNAWKCSLPMHYTTDAGKYLCEKFTKTKSTALLGHIRQASPKVPIIRENSHPFVLEGITFVHNGKLIPRYGTKFIDEKEVPDLDINNKKIIDPKTQKIKTKTVSISDSLIFFEEFTRIWKTQTDKNQDVCFVNSVKEAMKSFTGTFAMSFVINKVLYIVRGRTKNLYISYLQNTVDNSSKVLGWAINTDKENLENSTILLSNLNQTDGKSALVFTFPELLKEETIFKANDFGLDEIGEISEGFAATPSSTKSSGYFPKGADEVDFTEKGTYGKTTGAHSTEENKLYQDLYNFMVAYSLTENDVSNLFIAYYDASLLEVEVEILKQFCRQVVPKIAKKTEKDIRRALKKVLYGFPLLSFQYPDGFKYPWFLNSKKQQQDFVDKLRKESEKK